MFTFGDLAQPVVKPMKKTQQKTCTKQFNFMPVIIKDSFTFTASNDQQVTNCKFLDYLNSKVQANLNKSLADELNQPTSFQTACSNKKNLKEPNKTPKQGQLGFLKTWVFLNPGSNSE